MNQAVSHLLWLSNQYGHPCTDPCASQSICCCGMQQELEQTHSDADCDVVQIWDDIDMT